MFRLPQRLEKQVADLCHLFVHSFRRPARGIHGGQHLHPHGAWLKDKIALGCNITGVVDNHRHDGNPHLHGHVEAALFERCQFACRCPGTLGCNHEGFPLVFHGRHQRCHGFDGLAPIGAVNKHHAGGTHGLSNQGHPLDFLFPHADHVPAHQARHDGDIGLALVVEHEHRRPLAPEIFLAADIKVQPDQGAGGIGEQGDRKVQGIPFAAG